MEEPKDFDFINSTYWHMFSYSNLNVFLDRFPTGNSFLWKFKRFMNYFFLFFYFPTFFSIQVAGLFLGREGNLPQLAFDISYIAHLIQVMIKTTYYIYYIEDIRKVCLNFENFHSTHHRPHFSRFILGRKGIFLRKLARIYYTTIYMNLSFWSISPLVIQPTLYILTQAGVIESGADTIIPKFFPVRYPFDETSTQNRIIIAFLEFIVLTAGFIYFIPIDQFIVSVILMMCAEMEVISKSIQSRQQLVSDFGNKYQNAFSDEDEDERISLKLFIEDHQHGLKVTRRISEIINPILGVTLTNSMVCLCTLAIFITKKAKTAESGVEFFREVSGFFLVMTTSIISLYLYSWMCGELKKSEENIFFSIYSSNWYEQNKDYRDGVLIIMGQSFKSRTLKTLGIGDIKRETFIQGLRIIYSYYNFLANFD